jgi:wobble nucleotide-excising tRNase
MIRRIQHIKAFGVFADFHWPPALPEFKQFNLIYGWNYSGKTTLSRAFRCFEQKLSHVDFAGAQVQLKSEDGTDHYLSAPHAAPVFRVFNSDFIHENLSFGDGSATPILVLGAEDIAKQEALKAKKTERDALNLSMEANMRKKGGKAEDIEKGLTKYARDFIKNPLAEVNYDKRRFEPKVIECKVTPEQHLLDDETLAECLAVYRSTDKKDALSAKVISLSSVAELKEKSASLLARVVTANNPIPRLKETPAVEAWVNEGRPLHAGKDTCQFCGQSLPEDLLAHLTEHFSADYENLMAELSALEKVLDAAQEEEIALDHKTDFYAELSERFTIEKSKLDTLLKARKAALGILVAALSAKQSKAFSTLQCPAVDDHAEQITSAVEAVNTLVIEHNKRTADFDTKRQEACR